MNSQRSVPTSASVGGPVPKRRTATEAATTKVIARTVRNTQGGLGSKDKRPREAPSKTKLSAEVGATGIGSPPLVARGAECENQLISTMAPRLAASKAQTSRVRRRKASSRVELATRSSFVSKGYAVRHFLHSASAQEHLGVDQPLFRTPALYFGYQPEAPARYFAGR